MSREPTGSPPGGGSAGDGRPGAVEPVPISVVVLTRDEELNLPGCLESLGAWARDVWIVDSGSTDATLEVAARHGARVVTHPFETHARQWSWALANLPIETEWVLGLDADQRVTPELRRELEALFAPGSPRLDGVDGFFVNRRQVFRGRWIRHGGYYPKYLLKLFRRGKVRIDVDDLVDHHFYVDGRVGRLRYDLVEENKREDDISFWIEKHNRYATLLAREEWRRRVAGRSPAAGVASAFGDPDQRVLWRKGLWNRLPPYVRPFLYFGYRYVMRLGFLDGKEGLVFHFLHACWFRFLVDVKIEEARAAGSSQKPGQGS